MERTPKTRHTKCLSVSREENSNRPGHSTPEASTSVDMQESVYPEEFSPIDSPDGSDYLCDDYKIYWGWKSPDEIPRRKPCANLKTDVTPKTKYFKYLSPKPKRMLIRPNYAEKLHSWVEEFKSFSEGMKIVAGKSMENEVKEKEKWEGSEKKVCGFVNEETLFTSKENVSEICVKVEDELLVDETCKAVPQDCLVVELSQGLNSLKSFPDNFQFPKVPKLELEDNLSESDYVVLMEDNSIEDELIKCTQQIEEQILGRNGKAKRMISPCEDERNVTNTLGKFTDYIASPKSSASPLLNLKSPVLSRLHTSGRKCIPSFKSVENLNFSKSLDTKVSWDDNHETVNMKESEASKEEVMCMLEEDSFDNVMLELVVEGEKNASPTLASHSHENKFQNNSLEESSIKSIKVENGLKAGNSFGMLEDDSLIQPDVLNFLDTVENQAIAASQPLKCTPEEIQKKMIEAKKKLAVGKRKRRSQMACSCKSLGMFVVTKEKVNS